MRPQPLIQQPKGQGNQYYPPMIQGQPTGFPQPGYSTTVNYQQPAGYQFPQNQLLNPIVQNSMRPNYPPPPPSFLNQNRQRSSIKMVQNKQLNRMTAKIPSAKGMSPQPAPAKNLFKQKTITQEGKAAIHDLKLKVNNEDQKDQKELSKILGDYLKFPSNDNAHLHGCANRLGNFDIKNRQVMTQLALSQIQQPGKQQNSNIVFCKCCGLSAQQDDIGVKQSLTQVNHLGVSIYLYFFTIKSLTLLLFIFCLTFCGYAILTNMTASQLYKNHLYQIANFTQTQQLQIDDKQKSFQGQLQASLGSKQFYHNTYAVSTFQIQCWLGAISLVVWAVMFAVIKYLEKKHQDEIDLDSITPTDFTLIFQDLPKDMTKQQLENQLKDYLSGLRYWFDPNFVPNKNSTQVYEQLLSYDIQIEKINLTAPFYLNVQDFQSDELDQVKNQYNQIKDTFRSCVKQRRNNQNFQVSKEERQKLYKRFGELRKKKKQMFTAIVDNLKQTKKKQAVQLQCVDAFVTFKNNANKQLLQRIHESQSLFIYDLPCFNNNHYFSYKTRQGVPIKTAVITQAPQPQDVMFVNYGQSTAQKIKTYAMTFAVTLLVLCVSFFIIYGLTQVQLVYKAADEAEQQSQKQSNDSLTDSAHKSLLPQRNKILTFIVQNLVAFGLIAVDHVVPMIVGMLTQRERNISYTRDQTSAGLKSALVVLLNIILVPIAVNIGIKGNAYGSDGLIDDVYSFALTNAYMAPILKLMNTGFIIARVKQFIFNLPIIKLYMSVDQNDLNANAEYNQFSLGDEYVQVVTVFLFTCFFASLQPLIVPLAVAKFFLYYWIQKVVLYKICKRPIPGNNVINTAMYQLIFLGPLLYTIGSICWSNLARYQLQGQNRPVIGSVPNSIALIISILIMIIPYKVITKQFMRRTGQEKQFKPARFQEDRIFFSSQYDRLNPATSDEAGQQHQQYLKQYMKKLKFASAQIQKKLMDQFKSQNGMGGKTKNIYANFVDKQDQDLVAETFVSLVNTINPLMTGKAIQTIKQLQQKWKEQKIQDQQVGKITQAYKHIIVIINENDTMNQYTELQQFLRLRKDDPYLRQAPIYMKYGDFKNKNSIITVYDPNKMDQTGFDDYDDDDYIDTRVLMAAGCGFAAGAAMFGGGFSNNSIGGGEFSNNSLGAGNGQQASQNGSNHDNQSENNQQKSQNSNKSGGSQNSNKSGESQGSKGSQSQSNGSQGNNGGSNGEQSGSMGNDDNFDDAGGDDGGDDGGNDDDDDGGFW